MDKHTSDMIKIKINGKERQLSQEDTAEELAVSSWDEKLKAEKEVASAKQPIEEEDDFPWLLPEEDDSIFKDDPKVVTPSKKKIRFSNQTVTPYQYSNNKIRKKINGTFPFKKMMTIIVLAIVLGFMFGLIGLNFLSNEDMPTMGSSVNVTSEDSTATGESPNQENNNDDKDTAGNESAASTATLNLYAVQGGIFSAKTGAETVASKIKEKGFAATVIETNGSYTVFAGFGKERTETGSLSEMYQKQNFADIEFWGGKELSLTISTGSAAQQWATAIQELSSLAAAAANGNTPSQEAVTEIETTIKSIKANGEEEKTLIENLLKAAESIKNNSGWDAQQYVLDVTSKITTN
ncbi:SPOR domain-containing protein [uncultured Metabacillus sp.]|uniref:SPOR domain-containing protein n=1 Tax=uncultured Metabacillus sp. TaxID=2860135 RepID=UPI002603E498|nr:SPOR domain-containing protein [uncultured Metabacillus sp.]